MDIYVSKKPNRCSDCYFCNEVILRLSTENKRITENATSRITRDWVSTNVITDAKLITGTRCILLNEKFSGNTPYCERLEKCPLVEISEILDMFQKSNKI